MNFRKADLWDRRNWINASRTKGWARKHEILCNTHKYCLRIKSKMKSSSSLLWIAIELQKHKLGLGIGIELAKPQKNKIVTAATKLFHKADNSRYLTSQAQSDRLCPPACYTPTERRSSSASLQLCQAAPQGRCLGQPESSHTHTCTGTQDRSQGTSRALWTEAGGRGGERPLQHSWCGSSCVVHPW